MLASGSMPAQNWDRCTLLGYEALPPHVSIHGPTVSAHHHEAAVGVVLQALRVQVAGAQVLDGQRQALAVRHLELGAQRLDVDRLRALQSAGGYS